MVDDEEDEEVLRCAFCGLPFEERIGNVVIPVAELSPSATITAVRIECKACARLRTATLWHAIWELSWIVKEPLRYAFQIVEEQSHNSQQGLRYSEDALNDLVGIFWLIHPDLFGRGPLAIADEAQ